MTKGKKTKAPGRPTEYSHALALEICDVISESAKGLKPLCDENPHWPNPRTIQSWVMDNDEFTQMYCRAKIIQAERIIDECFEIVDDASRDTICTERDGEIKETCNTEWVSRSKLRVDFRKWLVSKLVPKVYGNRDQQIIFQQKFEDLAEEEQIKFIEQLSTDKKLKLFNEVAKKIKSKRNN